MNTLFPPTFTNVRRPTRKESEEVFAGSVSPHYESNVTAEGMQISVFMPAVEATGVEILVRGPDLTVIGRKTHPLRVNFEAAYLEGVQRDYELRLRLGRDLDYTAVEADLSDGILTVRVPRRHLRAA